MLIRSDPKVALQRTIPAPEPIACYEYPDAQPIGLSDEPWDLRRHLYALWERRWLVAASPVAALLIAVAALMHSRRVSRQLAEVTHMYWQLKFDHGELKAKVDPSQPAPPEPKSTFVPLTQLKR